MTKQNRSDQFTASKIAAIEAALKAVRKIRIRPKKTEYSGTIPGVDLATTLITSSSFCWYKPPHKRTDCVGMMFFVFPRGYKARVKVELKLLRSPNRWVPVKVTYREGRTAQEGEVPIDQ